MSIFFGLKPEDKTKIHDEIFDLCFYSEGGFGWNAVYYAMPIHVRKYYINKANEFFKKKKEEIEKEKKKAKTKSPKGGKK